MSQDPLGVDGIFCPACVNDKPPNLLSPPITRRHGLDEKWSRGASWVQSMSDGIEQNSRFHFCKFLSTFKWAGDGFLRSSVDSTFSLMRSKLRRLHSEWKVLGRQQLSPKTEQLPEHNLTLAAIKEGPSNQTLALKHKDFDQYRPF